MTKDKAKIKSNVLIIIATLIWGTAFAAQSVAMDYLSPFTFNGARFIVGGLVTLPPAIISSRRDKSVLKEIPGKRTNVLLAGVCCGVVLFISSALQQFGILYTTVGKAGFITSLYVVIVPLFGLFTGRRVSFKVWTGVGFAVLGMYLLCVSGGFGINIGDGLILACALTFSVHILLIDRFAGRVNHIAVSCVQFFTVGILATISAFIVEKPDFSQILKCAWPILYTGVFSSGVAYTLQIIAQKNTDPEIASLLFSLESVFAAVTGFIFLGERLSVREAAGCVLVMLAIAVAQWPGKKRGGEKSIENKNLK